MSLVSTLIPPPSKFVVVAPSFKVIRSLFPTGKALNEIVTDVAEL